MSNLARFSFPTTVIYGAGAVETVPEALGELGISRPLIVTDPPLAKTEAFGRLETVLRDSGTDYSIYTEVHPNPLDTDVEGALDLYRKKGRDGIIGIGGGSSLDTSKALAVLAGCGGSLSDYDVQQGGGTKITKPLPPIVAIPTTAGTGSEVGRCAVITSSSAHRKYMVCHPRMMPGRAILDPVLTVSLPPGLTAATGMDALTHNIESLTAPVFHPMCDAIAVKGVELAAKNLERAVKKPGDLEARGNMLLAAMMGAVAFQKDLGATHSLSHALSAVCGLQHGLANAVCLVPVMKYNIEAAREQYALLAPYFGIDTHGMAAGEAARETIEAIRQLNERIGIPSSLKELGVKREQFEEITEKAFMDPCHLTNIRACTRGDLRDLLEEAWRGA